MSDRNIGEKGNAFVMGENRCFMKEKTLKELDALERSITSVVEIADDISPETVQVGSFIRLIFCVVKEIFHFY